MRSLSLMLVLGSLIGGHLGGCYVPAQQPIEDPDSYAQEEHAQDLAGPPGGGMDPMPGYVAPGSDNGAPLDPVQTPLTDDEIGATLDSYGSWVDDPDYGRVWRPSATVVGADFTPYESCGQWVYLDTDQWSFQCDWDWGWLPFHYGQWAMMDDGWGWVPGYDWSPAWVDWRDGGGYVGWRPSAPRIRDHRHLGGDPAHPDILVRDHRREPNWRFVAGGDFSRPHLHDHVLVTTADALHATAPVPHPTVIPSATIHPGAVMAGRAITSPRWHDAGMDPLQPGGGLWRGGRTPGGPGNQGIARPTGGRQPTYGGPRSNGWTNQGAVRAPTYRGAHSSGGWGGSHSGGGSYGGGGSHSGGGSYGGGGSHSGGGSYGGGSHSSGGGGSHSSGGGGSHSSGGGSHSSGGGGGHHR
jgi:hypothetical protein